MFKTLFIVLSLPVIMFGCALMPMGLPHNTIVDGNSMVYVQDSNWPPTVVFESGLGDGFSTWADVYSKSSALMLPPHIAAEIQGIQSSEANAPLSADIGNIPTILIAATKPPPGASSDAQTVWLSVQKEFADSLTDGDLVIAEGSGHYVQKDAPQIVVDEIRHLITSIRSNDI